MQPKRRHHWWVRVRREIAPLLLDPDADYEALAQRFGINSRTVRNWHRIVQEKGIEALIQIHDGRPQGSTLQAAARTAVARLKAWLRPGGLYGTGNPAQPVYGFARIPPNG
jgi:transposase-like protein